MSSARLMRAKSLDSGLAFSGGKNGFLVSSSSQFHVTKLAQTVCGMVNGRNEIPKACIKATVITLDGSTPLTECGILQWCYTWYDGMASYNPLTTFWSGLRSPVTTWDICLAANIRQTMYHIMLQDLHQTIQIIYIGLCIRLSIRPSAARWPSSL